MFSSTWMSEIQSILNKISFCVFHGVFCRLLDPSLNLLLCFHHLLCECATFSQKFQTMHHSGPGEPPELWQLSSSTYNLLSSSTLLRRVVTWRRYQSRVAFISERPWLRPPNRWWELVAHCHPWFYSGKTWNFPGYLQIQYLTGCLTWPMSVKT